MDREQEGGRQQSVRASDADRDNTIATLRKHHVDGRLQWEEFAERLDRASQARTREQLRELLADLPPPAEPGALAGPAREPVRQWPSTRWSRNWWWGPWLVPPVLVLAVLVGLLLGAWAFGDPGPYQRGFFFPIFPLLFWGFLLARIVLPRRRWRRW
jgi:hypothetical protein